MCNIQGGPINASCKQTFAVSSPNIDQFSQFTSTLGKYVVQYSIITFCTNFPPTGQWKNFENRPMFGEDMNNDTVVCSLLCWPTPYVQGVAQHAGRSTKLCYDGPSICSWQCMAMPAWIGAMSTSTPHDAQAPISVVWQCKLVSGWGRRKCRSAPYGSGMT